MSVYISDFTSSTEWQVIHDDARDGGHTGTIDPTTITYVQNMDGSHNHDFAAVTCPVCGTTSTHPVGGGAQPPLVQEMFVRKVDLEGCVCAEVAASDPSADAIAHVKALVTAMEGAERWQIDEPALLRSLGA
jgi:hypothetical protein